MEWIKDEFLLTDDFDRVDTDVAYQLLKDTYWEIADRAMWWKGL